MTRLIISDMDGTLVDSMNFLSSLGVLVMVSAGIPEEEALRHYWKTVGLPFDQQLGQWNLDHPDTIDSLPSEKLFTFYQQVHRLTAPLFPLTPFGQDIRLMSEEDQSRWKVALVSSTRKDIVVAMPQVKSLPLAYVGGYDGKTRIKSMQVREAVQACGVTLKDCVYVGDSQQDADIATALDIPFFLVSSTTYTDILAYEFPLAVVP
jgi:phosphoglycolate phosphatase-like HAD superfamily hydrolase